MGEPLYERAPTIFYLRDLVAQVVDGTLLLPRFRRNFVWTDEQRLALFDSVVNGLPFGSFLVWRTGKTLRSYRAIGRVVLAPPAELGVRNYLLDGLQRLSTFVGALSVPDGAASTEETIGAEEEWDIVYDLERAEFALLSNVEQERRAMVLPLSAVLGTKRYLVFQRRLRNKLLDLGMTEHDIAPLVERADEVASAIRDVKVPVVFLATESLQVASVAFQRLNAQGTQMSEVHMVNALTFSEQFDLLGRIEELMPSLAEYGWGELDPQTILHTCRALVGLPIHGGDLALISDVLRQRPSMVDEAFDALELAVLFLRDECGVAGPAMLPFSALLVCLAAVMHEMPAVVTDVNKQRELAAWFWLSVYSRTPFGVSGGVDSLLEFVRDLAKGAKGVKWWGQAVDKVERLPKMMRLDASRVVTLVAQLCRLGPRTIKGEPVKEPHLLVARRGAEVLAPLLDAKTMKRLGLKRADKLTAVANRVLVEPEDLGALRDGLPGLPRKVLDSHAITPEAVEALKRKDVEGFFRLREEHLIALEQAFLDETRRTLARSL
jgi:hypothetical protein